MFASTGRSSRHTKGNALTCQIDDAFRNTLVSRIKNETELIQFLMNEIEQYEKDYLHLAIVGVYST